MLTGKKKKKRKKYWSSQDGQENWFHQKSSLSLILKPTFSLTSPIQRPSLWPLPLQSGCVFAVTGESGGVMLCWFPDQVSRNWWFPLPNSWSPELLCKKSEKPNYHVRETRQGNSEIPGSERGPARPSFPAILTKAPGTWIKLSGPWGTNPAAS